MRKIIFYNFILLWVLSITSVSAQEVWSFDNTAPLVSNNHMKLIHHSLRSHPELVDGISGKGLRTDGYTTWATVNFVPSKKIEGISGWFALESFPTDTAAFCGVRSVDENESISVCADRFGKVMIHHNETYISTTHNIKRFEWIHIALCFDKKNVVLYVNGEKINTTTPIPVRTTHFNELIIAKDFRDKRLGIHHLTAINGIADEITIQETPLNNDDIKKEVAAYSSVKATLAPPVSRFAGDFSRPTYHLLPAANWTNETHGLLYHNGKYHIFNQKNASNLFLGQINWGHFSSRDLIHWTEHKPAITPEPGCDENGIWSGHAVINDQGTPTLIYTTGGEKLGVGIAFPTDSDLIEWKKYENNPVIAQQPPGFTRTDMRDQYVWKENNTWYMIVGYGIVENNVEKGAVLLYKSPDLKEWKFVHTLFEGNPEVDDSGIFWEMPVYWKFEDKYILLVNKVPHKGVPARAMYWSGEFKNEKFIPDDVIPKNLEVVNRLLSPSVAYDSEQRVTTIAIIPDEIGGQAAYAHGWTHLYSIPRVWNFRNGCIEQSPHPALKQLREEHTNISLTSIDPSTPLLLTNDDNRLEVRATIYPGTSQKFGFMLHQNADNSEYTKIYYDAQTAEVVVDQRYSSLKKHIPLNVRKGEYTLDLSQPVDFHLFIDGSVVEVFINNKDAFTTRIFPLHRSSSRLSIFTAEGHIKATAEMWEMKPANMNTDF